jgi:hypothetical protein
MKARPRNGPGHLPNTKHTMKKLTLLLTLILAVSTPAFAAKGKGKVLHPLDTNNDHQITGDEVTALNGAFAKADAGSLLRQLDKNTNGKLDEDEITALNARLAKQADKKGGKKNK